MKDLVAVTAMDRRIKRIVGPIIESQGYELVRLRFRGGTRKVLQIMAERPDGSMNLSDCDTLSKAISAFLDVADPIDSGYSLEVSSPGIDRPLTRLSHFREWAGHEVRIQLSQSQDGQLRFRGRLNAVEDETISIVTDAGPADIHFNSISSAKLLLTDELLHRATRHTEPGAGPAAETSGTAAKDYSLET